VKPQKRRRLRRKQPSKGQVPVLSAAFALPIGCSAAHSLLDQTFLREGLNKSTEHARDALT
jgi:hypothetical protein